MALSSLNFSKQGERWYSDVFIPETSNIAIGVKFPKRVGSATVHRSIDGVNWAVAGMIPGPSEYPGYILQNVCGFVIGESFKVETSEEPESIHFLE